MTSLIVQNPKTITAAVFSADNTPLRQPCCKRFHCPLRFAYTFRNLFLCDIGLLPDDFQNSQLLQSAIFAL